MPIKKSELYSSLWSSCDALRGGMDASQYKDYVLVLLFIKYISDKYAGQPYAPISIPAGAGFKDMVALKGKPDIGDQINKKIIAPLAEANQNLSQADFPDFNDPVKLGDLKAYEADMRHLIDTYIEADEPRRISPFDNMGLLDLIVKTGIANAIATQLGGLKGSKNAIAETIENNVRYKIIKEHLNDPAYFETMSALLDEIIAARKAKAIEYEEYLKRIAELAKRVDAGQSEDTPEEVNTPGRRALYNNLSKNRDLALEIDRVVKTVRHDGWRGVQAREQAIKRGLYEVLKNVDEVERIFLIVKQQREY